MTILELAKLAKKFAKHPETYPIQSSFFVGGSTPLYYNNVTTVASLDAEKKALDKRIEAIQEYEGFIQELDAIILELGQVNNLGFPVNNC